MRRTVLVGITTFSFLLGGLLTAAVLGPQHQAKAAARMQYKVVPLPSPQTQALQSILDRHSADGWELVAIEMAQGHFIFKK
jgi:hypothetical protein